MKPALNDLRCMIKASAIHGFMAECLSYTAFLVLYKRSGGTADYWTAQASATRIGSRRPRKVERCLQCLGERRGGTYQTCESQKSGSQTVIR